MTELQNSAFKEKASRVEDVSKILPEVGAVVLNNHDGRLYAADQVGWHRFGDPYANPVFVDFNGVDQFRFTFRAPSGTTVTIDDGNGNQVELSGADDVDVIYDTTYTEADTYNFSIVSGAGNMTLLDLSGQPISGAVGSLISEVNLVTLDISGTQMYGDLGSLDKDGSLTTLKAANSLVFGDISTLAANNIIEYIDLANCEGVIGNIGLEGAASLRTLLLSGTGITFTTDLTLTVDGLTVDISDCLLHADDVDKAIVAFSTCTNSTFDVSGNNENRSADTNDDLNTLLANGSTIGLNDVLGSELIRDVGFLTSGADLNTSNCVNGPGGSYSGYDTFTNATPTGFDAVSNGDPRTYCSTADEISFVSGQKYVIAFDMVLNSGDGPQYNIAPSIGGSTISVEGWQRAVAGANTIVFTANDTVTGVLEFTSVIGEGGDFEITNLSVKDAGWDVSAASWSIAAGVASYDDLNDNQAMLQIDGSMLISIVSNTVYRFEFTSAATPTNAALALKNSALDVTFIAQSNYTDGTHVVYFTSPPNVSGGGLGFVGYQAGDAYDLDNVSLKEVTFSTSKT